MRLQLISKTLAIALAVTLGVTTAFFGQGAFASEPQGENTVEIEAAEAEQISEPEADSWRFDGGAYSEEYLDENAQMGSTTYQPQEFAVSGSSYGNKRNKKWVFRHFGKKVTCSGGYLKGIDISVWQNRSRSNRYINWKKVKREVKRKHLDFVIIRCGYGVNVKSKDDSEFKYNVTQCEKRKIPYGVYLYSYAKNTSQAKSEANHALRLLKGHHPDYPVYYDLEDRSILRATGKSRSKVTNIAKTFCTRIVNNGYKAGVYANKSWFDSYIDGASLKNSGVDLWLAQWFYRNKKYSAGPKYSIWQCCSSGTVKGIYGRVDLNLLVVKHRTMRKLMSDESLPSTLKIEKPDMTKSQIKISSVTSRKGPGFGYKASKKYTAGTIVKFTGMANGYYRLESGRWIATSSVYQPKEPKEFNEETGTFRAYDGSTIVSAWINWEGNRYYATETGTLQTGVVKIGKYRYGFDDTGVMVKGVSKWFGSKKYAFDSKGRAYQKKATLKKNKPYRSGPGTKYAKKGTLKKGKSIYIIRQYGDWYQMPNGYWTKNNNLLITRYYPIYRPETDDECEAEVIEACDGMSGPKSSYIKITSYKPGDIVIVVGTYGTWAKLSTGDWVPWAKLSELTPAEPEDPPAAEPVEDQAAEPEQIPDDDSVSDVDSAVDLTDKGENSL